MILWRRRMSDHRLPEKMLLRLSTLFLLVNTYFLFLPISTNASPRLVISPEGPSLRRAVKKPFVLTCKGDGDNPSLFSDLRWFDPLGNEILDYRWVKEEEERREKSKFCRRTNFLFFYFFFLSFIIIIMIPPSVMQMCRIIVSTLRIKGGHLTD